jgi:hypothetical protein
MSNIGGGLNRMDKPNSVDLTMGTDGATIGASHQLTPALSVGADLGSSHGQATVGANATAHIFPDKNFSPFATLGVNLGVGGSQGFNPNVDLKGGVDYTFNSGFQVGAYAGVDRSFGDANGSPWGAEAGITAGIRF